MIQYLVVTIVVENHSNVLSISRRALGMSASSCAIMPEMEAGLRRLPFFSAWDCCCCCYSFSLIALGSVGF